MDAGIGQGRLASDQGSGARGRVVLLNASYAPSLVNFRGHFIDRMIAAGHEVHVTAPDFTPDVAQALRQKGARVHGVPLSRAGLSPTGDIRYLLRIRELIRKVGADMVVSYTIKPNIWASLAARSLGVRSASLVTGLGYAFIDGAGLKRRLVSAASGLLYRLATKGNEVVIFQNPDDRDDFTRAGCLGDSGKARLINGSGVDTRWYAPAPLPDRPVFLMISRLLGNKGCREYAEAALRILARRGDCRFLLAGFFDQGPDAISPEEAEKWMEGGLEFLGPLTDVRPAIAQASIYVLPSYREGTPRSVLEAMSMARAIITTDVPGCRETVEDGESGLLVAPRDVTSLVLAMERLIDDAGLRARLAAAARARCVEKYDVEKVSVSLMRHLSLEKGKA